jgi:hypothetical protein
MTGAWFAGELAAVATGAGLAVIVIRRWLAPLLPADAPDRRRAIGFAAASAGGSAVIPLTAGLVLMWRWPGTAVADFIVAGFGLTLGAWFASRRRRAVRDSAGREPAPTDRD